MSGPIWFELIQTPTVQERFWSKVAVDADAACWDWTRSTGTSGYGQFMVVAGKLVRAHRVAWALINGPIPDGAVIRHTCDRPICCNPAHLLHGSQADNVRDAVERGRARGGSVPRPGELSPTHKISTEQALDIRARRAANTASCAELAVEYGIHRSQVSRIATGHRWAHLEAAA